MMDFLGLLALCFFVMFSLAGVGFLCLWKLGFLPTLDAVPFPFAKKRSQVETRLARIEFMPLRHGAVYVVVGVQSAMYSVSAPCDVTRIDIYRDDISLRGAEASPYYNLTVA
jgi:hypothetical protein